MDESKKKYTILSKIVAVGIILATIIGAIMNGTLFNPARVLGAFIATSGISFLFGIIPFLIFRNKIKNPKTVIFGIIFIFITLLSTLGNLVNLAKDLTTNIDTAKPIWINNCIKSATSGDDEEEKRRFCECLFDSLVEKYTWKKLSTMESSSELSQSIKDLGRRCMEKEGYLFSDKLKETYKSSYIESCVGTGASKTNCSCYFDLLIEKLGIDGFGEMGKVLDEKPVNSPEVKKYLDIILEQKNKCGQLK